MIKSVHAKEHMLLSHVRMKMMMIGNSKAKNKK